VAYDGTSSPPYQHIAEALRAEIEAGRIPVGHQLPTQAALVRRFDVSRSTVQRALEKLKEDGWIDSQRGRGSYVLSRPEVAAPGPAGVELAEHVQAAFAAARVTLDAFSITSETLNAAVQAPLLRIRNGELRPESITVRLLVPSLSADLAVPRRVGHPDDPRPLQRLRRLVASQAVTLQSSISALADLGLVADVSVEVRSVPTTPLEKLYLLNATEALSGYYQIVERPITIGGEELAVYDVLGLASTLFHHSATLDPHNAQFVARAQGWFDGLWSTIAEPLTLLE
jgi:DNA-binding transcriptional regulator YhcF (GntR family)